jgi:flagellar M-ring protein FliF
VIGENSVQQLVSVWTALGPRRQLVAGGAAIVVFLAVLGLARVASQPPMALLYAGLEGQAAGELVQALEARNIAYEVRGDAVYVRAAERDQTRMLLAAAGLPASAGRGYELLDGMSGFGTTAQMFDAAYWRAKEGELARTIVSSPQVRAARVHIAHATAQPFRREIAPTAAVTVTPAAGSLPPAQARALRFLVAAAVPGMRPENVSVIDAATGTVISAEEGTTAPGGGPDREEELRRAVERLMAAHVGAGRSVVEVSLETVTETESIVERRIDPESRVAVLSELEESTSSSTDSRNAGVTVASNLPDGDAGDNAGRSQSQNAESRERQSFEVSQTQRELHRAPGAIRRLTVAVLVDGVVAPDETGAQVWQPRGEAELETLRELVAAAVGFDAERGDLITVRSLPFQTVEVLGTEATSGVFDGTALNPMALIQLAVLAVVALILGLFVLRPLLDAARGRSEALPGPDEAAAALGGPPPAAIAAAPAAALAAAPPGEGDRPGGPEEAGLQGEDPVQRLRRLIEERQDETVEILRGWMEDGEKDHA